MPLFMYRCPKTEYRVQGFSAEDISEDHHIYEPVTCPACRQVHHVNPRDRQYSIRLAKSGKSKKDASAFVELVRHRQGDE